jgi:hypothetical protein
MAKHPDHGGGGPWGAYHAPRSTGLGADMADQTQTPVSPRDPKKTYGLAELVRGTTPGGTKPPEETVFTWPHLVYVEFIAMIASTVVLIILSLISGAPLEESASADTTPNPMKAPWYFLGLQELLVFFDPWLAGVVLPGLIIVGLMVIPFIDINPKGIGQYNYADRKFAVLSFCFGLALWYIFIVVGVYLRGLDWQWYWPWDNWLLHKEAGAVSLIDLEVIMAQKFGISQKITNLITYGITGVFYAIGFTIPFIFFRKFYQALGFVRYNLLMFFFMTMMLVPFKVMIRLVFNIKYLLITPWFKI